MPSAAQTLTDSVCEVESNTEKEKGQASDAFKRAGFNVGIGRELYTGPFIYVELADNEFYSEGQQNGRKEVLKCYSNTRFKVTRVAYNDRREIVDLVIVDRNGNVRFDMNKRVEGPKFEITLIRKTGTSSSDFALKFTSCF